MKRLIAYLISFTILAAGCAAQDNGTGTETPAESRTEQETAVSQLGAETDGSTEKTEDGSGNKPALEIIGEEEEDFDRAVNTRKKKTAPGSKDYILHECSIERPEDNVSTETLKKYTVMVYIVGSNLEGTHGLATDDINEMTEAGLDYDETNLLLYTGGSMRWFGDIPNNVNCVWDLSKEEGHRIAAQTDVSANMGASETLAEFINYCTHNYPAEHYALILWDHGGGPVWGYGNDELFGGDSLLLEELREAMDSTEFCTTESGSGKKLDWVGFDACLMGSLENAALWKDYAQYLVSSEEAEAETGWDYHFLSILNETQHPEEIVRSAVDAYGKYYEENQSQFSSPDATLSVMDLSKVEEALYAVDSLSDAMDKGIAGGEYALISKARSRSKALGLGLVESPEQGYDLIDLRDFAGQLEELYPEECAKVLNAVDMLVTYSASNTEDISGVSIYVPGLNKALYNASGELSPKSVLLSSQYQSFVRSFAKEWYSELGIDWHLAELRGEDGELTLQLTNEQAENVSQAYYAVLWRASNGEFMRAMLDVPIEADENGMLHIPSDPLLMTVITDDDMSSIPWACRQISSRNNVNKYSTIKTYICAAHEMTIWGVNADIDEPVEILIRNKEGELETRVQEVVSQTTNAWNSGKGAIDVSRFTTVMDMAEFGRFPARDENGEMKPYSEWDKGGSYTSNSVPVNDSFRFVLRPASEFSDSFVCQVVLKDVHNGVHATELREFNTGRTEQELTKVNTENGALYYKELEDHAEVYSYEGIDKEIVIAEKINGKPVTIISKDAFYKNDTADEENGIETIHLPDTITEIGNYAMPGIKQVNLPDGLKKIGIKAFHNYKSEEIEIPSGVEVIGSLAFSGAKLRSVSLPSSLRVIGSMPFDYCENLEEITIEGNNSNYKTVDGVLFTADGKTLIQYPNGKGSSYRIPEGTETIAYGAFSHNDYSTEISDQPLLQIEFPETLKTIENGAFYLRSRLESLTLPDSLEVIGTYAFGEEIENFFWIEGIGDYEEKVIERVHIGPNVREIGKRAFSVLKIKEFEVDPDNPAYASVGGFVTNKAGDTILIAPEGLGNTIVVPEGITTLPELVFADMTDNCDFYIPDSVFRFAKDVFGNPESTDLSKITIHCTPDSAAEAYAVKFGINCDTTGRPAELGVFREETFESGEFVMTFRVYADHAELVEVGRLEDALEVAAQLEIPAEYNGLPVTVLGYKDPDDYSSRTPYIQKIVIPETVQRVNIKFLSRVMDLEEIEVEEDNEYLWMKEGVLFDGDNILLYYPRRKKEFEYRVPEGIVKIGEQAFHSFFLGKVTLPDSVIEIGDNAFSDCSNLKDVTFGQCLETIGDHAFSAIRDCNLPSSVRSIGSGAFPIIDKDFGEIILPESLTYMGYGAFRTSGSGEVFLQDTLRIPAGLEFDNDCIDGVLLNNYEVDENNPYHSVIDGFLTSKDGRTLIAVPGQRKGDLYVPDGVMSIDFDAFDNCPYVTDVYLPDSIVDVGSVGSAFFSDESCTYKVHCREGSEAQKQLEANGIEWVKIE